MKHLLTIGLPATVVVVLVLLTVLMLPGFFSERESQPEQVQYLIGVSQANLIEPLRITMNREIEAAAAQHDSLRVIFTDATQSTDRQLEDVRMLLGYGIDLLVISPNDGEALRPIISQVFSQIPVIVLDRDVLGDEYTLFIGPNNYRIGQLAGDLVARMLGGKPGNVVEILGIESSPPVEERSRGFSDALVDYPNITIVQRLVADWMQDQAEDRMKEYLVVSQEDTDIVFAQNDAMAYGAYIAVNKLRVPGVRFVGVDGLEGANGGRDLVRNGILEATFNCPAGGKQAIEYALRILKEEKELPHRLILDPVEITAGKL